MSIRLHPSLTLGGVLLGALLAVSAVGQIWTPYDPTAIDLLHRLGAPAATHWLGTDPFGRDLASLVMVAAGHTLVVCTIAVAAGSALGILTGVSAVLLPKGGGLLLGIADLALGFPPILSAALIVTALGPGPQGLIWAIALFNLPVFARLSQTAAREVMRQDYVAAAKMAGHNRLSIAWRHILPNISAQLWVQVTVSLALAVLAEAALSYLGLGSAPPVPSLGRALSEYQDHIFDDPFLVFVPGSVIALFVLGLNLLGDGLRDVFDPHWEQR